jgi:large conductance mechanosensitive channel
MAMWKEFKTFALRGNVLDLAVAVILGAAFSRIVGSLVDDVLMPPLGLVLGGIDFKDRFLDLSGHGYRTLEEAKAAGAPTLRYGVFLNQIVTFLVLAFAVFLLVRLVNRWAVKDEASPAPATRSCPLCLSTIPALARRCAHCAADLPAAA